MKDKRRKKLPERQNEKEQYRKKNKSRQKDTNLPVAWISKEKSKMTGRRSDDVSHGRSFDLSLP